MVAFSALISGEFAPLFYGLRKGLRESNKSSVRRAISSCCDRDALFLAIPTRTLPKCENKCIFKNQFSPAEVRRPCELCDKMIKIALRGASLLARERVCFWVVLCGQHISQGTRARARRRRWDKDSVLQAARCCCCRVFVYLHGAEFGHSASRANTTTQGLGQSEM
jgi:hypothetical protein